MAWPVIALKPSQDDLEVEAAVFIVEELVDDMAARTLRGHEVLGMMARGMRPDGNPLF